MDQTVKAGSKSKKSTSKREMSSQEVRSNEVSCKKVSCKEVSHTEVSDKEISDKEGSSKKDASTVKPVEQQLERNRRALMGRGYEAEEIGSDAKTIAEYHSELAMQAARRMRRTRQKQKTGQEVCHHLRMMLASDPAPSQPRRRRGSDSEPQISLGF